MKTQEEQKAARKAYQAKYKKSPKGIAARRGYDRWYSKNMPISVKEKRLAYARARAKTPAGIASDRRTQLKKKYGLSENDYERMLMQQGGLCAICKKVDARGRLHVDHHHGTGRVRALLCGPCNSGLGYFKENILLLYKAADYVEQHSR